MFPFHCAICVENLQESEDFYTRVLGCTTGRKSSTWVDLNFFGHQLVCHVAPKQAKSTNLVDSDKVPVPHFGIILPMHDWHGLVERLRFHKVVFIIEPRIRFAGKPGEQATCFFQDPSGNTIECKAFADIKHIFAT